MATIKNIIDNLLNNSKVLAEDSVRKQVFLKVAGLFQPYENTQLTSTQEELAILLALGAVTGALAAITERANHQAGKPYPGQFDVEGAPTSEAPFDPSAGYQS